MASAQEVTNLYRELLGRDPDAGGLRHYMGTSSSYARRSIESSPERRAYLSRTSQPAATPAPMQVQADPHWENVSRSTYGDLENFDRTAKNPLDMYNSALDRLGIADIRGRVNSLRQQLLDNENLIRNVEPDVYARTTESLATDSQRRKLVASERAPLMGAQDVLERSFSSARGEEADVMGEAKTQAELEFEGQKVRRQGLLDRLQVAIQNAKNAEDKARWQSEYNRLLAKDQEETRRFNLEYALKQQSLAQAAAASRGGGGGGGKTTAKKTSSAKSSSAKTVSSPRSSGSSYVAAGGRIYEIGRQPAVNLQQAFASGGLR